MTFTIAIAGKGGTGKTTLAGILVDLLRQAGASPILAIDADPASLVSSPLRTSPATSIVPVTSASGKPASIDVPSKPSRMNISPAV